MPTISKELAEKLASNDGYYPDDPQAFAVFVYKSSFHGGSYHAVAYDQEDFNRYLIHEIEDILWQKEPQ